MFPSETAVAQSHDPFRTSVDELVETLNATAHGRRRCGASRIPNCQHDFFLMDRWDALLGELSVGQQKIRDIYLASEEAGKLSKAQRPRMARRQVQAASRQR